MQLNELERRVIGVLIEKALSTPDQYPLTLNALVNGCNQKSNRDPRMNLTSARVDETLDALRERGLVIFVDPARGRTRRYKTTARIELALKTVKDMAVIGELLLRGFGTLNELVRRASRMRDPISTEDMQELLAGFMARTPPLVKRLPKAPGQKEARYTHCLWGEGEEPEEAPPSAASAPRLSSTGLGAVETALAELRAEVAALTKRVEELEARG